MVEQTDIPIPRSEIEYQLVEYLGRDDEDADEDGYYQPTDEDIARIERQLERIQSFVADNLRTLLGNIYSPRAKGPIEVIDEDPECYYIGDHDDSFYHQLVSRVGPIDDDTVEVHNRVTHKKLHPNYDFDGEQKWIIKKPENWNHSQWTTDSFFTGLMESGVSPTQALDYWMVEVRGKRTGLWADIRDTSGEAIRQNVQKTKERLEETSEDSDLYMDRPNYFKRTYRGWYDDDRTKVRADHGYLNPRLDIARVGRTGLTWGYSGAGPTQLSYALLADATGNSDIPSDLQFDFRGMINRNFGDREWEITATEIRDWVEDHEEDLELK